MPRLKLSERERAGQNLVNNIRSRGAALKCYTFVDLERLTGIDSTTFCRNQKHPESWTLGNLFIIAQAMKVPIEWLFMDHTEVRL